MKQLSVFDVLNRQFSIIIAVVICSLVLYQPSLCHAVIAPTPSSSPPNVIVIGGSSGMGKAAALEALQHGSTVMIVSRSEEKLATAKSYLLEHVPNGNIQTATVDTMVEESVEKFADCLATDMWDTLIISAAGKAVHGPVETLPTQQVREMVDSKFWGAYHCAKYISPKLRSGGSIIFVSGILNRRPGINCAPLAIANGALEGLTRSLALELGPRLRVNCLSPGFTDTERFDHMDATKKEQMFINTAASLPLQTIGTPQDMGSALYYLSTAKFVTGVVLDVDGGHSIRQYASPINDPMRKDQS